MGHRGIFLQNTQFINPMEQLAILLFLLEEGWSDETPILAKDLKDLLEKAIKTSLSVEQIEKIIAEAVRKQ
jgi:hypothetical protein